MMVCKADFEELFPNLFTQSKDHAAARPDGPVPAGIDSGADDGGDPRSVPGQSADRSATGGHHVPDAARAGLAFATMPALAAHAAAWSMLAGFGRAHRR